MAIFLISYDAHLQRDYSLLYEAFEKYDVIMLHESLYIANLGNESAGEVRDWVRGLLDDDDSILVVKMKPPHNWAGRHLEEGAKQALKLYLSPES